MYKIWKFAGQESVTYEGWYGMGNNYIFYREGIFVSVPFMPDSDNSFSEPYQIREDDNGFYWLLLDDGDEMEGYKNTLKFIINMLDQKFLAENFPKVLEAKLKFEEILKNGGKNEN